jgi:hypothetical protein
MRLSRSLWQQLQVDQTTWRALARALASARRAQHLEQRASDKGGWEVGDRAGSVLLYQGESFATQDLNILY